MCSIIICCLGIFFLTMKHKMLKAKRRQQKQDKATENIEKTSKEIVGEILANEVQAVSIQSSVLNPHSGELSAKFESPLRSPNKSNYESSEKAS